MFTLGEGFIPSPTLQWKPPRIVPGGVENTAVPDFSRAMKFSCVFLVCAQAQELKTPLCKKTNLSGPTLRGRK